MKKNKKLLLFIYSIYIMTAVATYYNNELFHYSILYIIGTYILFQFMKDTNITNSKRTKKFVHITDFIFTIILIIGKEVLLKEYNLFDNLQIFNFKSTMKMMFCFGGFYIMNYYIFTNLYSYFSKVNIYNKTPENIINTKKTFIYSFFIIIICYCPYFLRCYPAIMSPDSYVEINCIEKNILSNFHPFIQTQFVGIIYKVGKVLFGKGNIAIAFYTTIQIIIIALINAYLISFLRSKKINKKLIIALIIFISLSPLNGFYSVTLWKDIIFGINFVLLSIAMMRIIDEDVNIKNMILLTFSILILLFFRNNGIYVFLLLIPTFIIFFKKKKLFFTTYFIIILAIFYFITGPFYNAIGVEKSPSIEAYSIPVQQVARVIASEKKIDEDSKRYLETIASLETIKKSYTPHISDPIKNIFNTKSFYNNKTKFIKVWLKLLIENPRIYIEAYLSSTLGYWYPDVNYHAIGTVNSTTKEYNALEYDIKNKTLLPEKINNLIDKFAYKNIPYSIVIWSTGLYCTIMFFSLIICIYLKNYKMIIIYMPYIFLWITLMLAAPVHAELRYIYGLFVGLPLLIIIPFMRKEKNEKRKK